MKKIARVFIVAFMLAAAVLGIGCLKSAPVSAKVGDLCVDRFCPVPVNGGYITKYINIEPETGKYYWGDYTGGYHRNYLSDSDLPKSCSEGSVNKYYYRSISECNVKRDESGGDLMSRANVIINVVLGVLGIITVAVIIVGGIRFTTSQGDATKAAKAKNTILFGVIGLIIALLAFAIVNFVLSGVFGR